MSNDPTKLSAKDAETLLLETSGAWLNLYRWFIGIGMYPIQRLSNNAPQHRRTDAEFPPARHWEEAAHLFSALAYSSFVIPYERYKKRCRHYGKDPSVAFGFGKYSDSTGDKLTEDYKLTIIHCWEPGNDLKDSWFADMMRNSFAHGQSTLEIQGGKAGISIWNARDGMSPNFDIFIDLMDFGPLVGAALSNFIAAFVEEGEVLPLSNCIKDLSTCWKKGIFNR